MKPLPPTPMQRLCMFPECTGQASHGFSPPGFSWRVPASDLDAPAGAMRFDSETVWTCSFHKDEAAGIADAREAARRSAERERFRPAQGSLL